MAQKATTEKMNDITKLNTFYTPKVVLKEILEEEKNMKCCVVLISYKDGSEKIFSSHSTTEEKAYAKCLFDAWATSWFDKIKLI